MLRPTPPAAIDPVPGLLVAGTAARVLRALTSTFAPPITTTDGSSLSTYPRPRITPFLPRFERCTLTAARVVPSAAAMAADPISGSRRSRATTSRSRSVSVMFVSIRSLHHDKASRYGPTPVGDEARRRDV